MCAPSFSAKHGNGRKYGIRTSLRRNHNDPKNIYVSACNLIHSNPISSTNSVPGIRTVPKVSRDSQVSFEPFTENKGFPCSWRFMGPAAGYDRAAAGGKPWGEEGDYWKPLADLPTCRPARRETPAPPSPVYSKPTLSTTTTCTLYSALL